jgi:hypothetical protein
MLDIYEYMHIMYINDLELNRYFKNVYLMHWPLIACI